MTELRLAHYEGNQLVPDGTLILPPGTHQIDVTMHWSVTEPSGVIHGGSKTVTITISQGESHAEKVG